MISVVISDPCMVKAEALLRSISSDLEADTPQSREIEIEAGPEVSRRLEALGDLPFGAAVITPGGQLSVDFLIHVVLQSPEDVVTPDGLRMALTNGLRRAEEWGVTTLAVPPLGTGPGKLDAQEAAAVILPVLSEHLQSAGHLREVLILAGTEYERDVFAGLLAGLDTPDLDHGF